MPETHLGFKVWTLGSTSAFGSWRSATNNIVLITSVCENMGAITDTADQTKYLEVYIYIYITHMINPRPPGP